MGVTICQFIVFTLAGLIFGYAISRSGATPIKGISFLRMNFSIPECTPESMIAASALTAAQTNPERIFPARFP